MADVLYDDVVKLADQLKPEEQEALVHHLQEQAARRLTPAEFQALFETLIFNPGPVDPNYSFRREDWYSDDER